MAVHGGELVRAAAMGDEAAFSELLASARPGTIDPP